jgi:predicted phosphodiesterase
MSYVYRHFIPQNTAPNGATRIGVYDGNGKKVCTIPLGGLTPPRGQPLYSFGLVSDCHTFLSLTTWDGNTKLNNALTYFESKGCAMVIGCGDFTQTGFYRKNESGADITLDDGTVVPNNTVYFDDRQMAAYRDIITGHTIQVFELFGNHENFNGKNITLHLDLSKTYTGIPATAYTVSNNQSTDEVVGTTVRPNRQIAAVGDDLFIFCGQPSAGYVMSADDFAWLTATLNANKNRRCFVFVHAYIEEDSGDPCDVRENSIFETWGTSNKNAFMELMRQYDNAVLFHGHSHMKFQYQEYDTNANYTERNGFKSVHTPSLGLPRDINFDTNQSKDDPSASQGYIVDVYDDCIVLNGMDFIGNKPVPLGVYKIET